MAVMPKIALKHVPAEERPRERLRNLGAGALSNAELLAILLRTGNRNESVLHLSERLLTEAEGIRNLYGMSIDEMMSLPGIGEAKAILIQAALELGRRVGAHTTQNTVIIRSPKDAADLMMEEMRNLKQEHFVCLFLNMKNAVIGKETVFVGSLNSSIVHPREIFRSAVKRSAASVICLHNHPSGDPVPSPEDIAVTQRLVDAGNLMGIDILDHLIIGEKVYTSMKEKGYM
jgi:DNA repair protein RadC